MASLANTEITNTFDVWRRNTNEVTDRLNKITTSGQDNRITLSGNVEVNISDFVVDTDNNRVGIGTSTPAVKLDVDGETNISADLKVDTDTLFVDVSEEKVGINNATPTEALDVTGKTLISDDLMVSGATSNVLFVDTSGTSVGINVDAPTASSLEISGDVLLQNTDELKIKNNGGTSQTVLTVNASDSTILQGSGGTESVAIKSSDGTSRITMTEAGVTAFSANVSIPDNEILSIGDFNDLIFYHDATDSYVQSTTGSLNIKSTFANSIVVEQGGAVTLYFSDAPNNAKLATTTNGVDITGTTTISSLTDNRITFAGTAGLLEDSADLTFDGTTFEVGGGYGGTGVDIDMLGNISADGNIVSNGTVTVVGLSSLDGGIDVNGAAFTVSAAGAVDTSTTLTVDGLSSLDGGIDVNAENFTVATSGAVDTANTLTVNGLSSLDGGIDVNGAFIVATDGGVTVSDTLDVTGITAFSSNVAFNTDTLFVDSFNDRVGINKIPTQPLDVTGNILSSATIEGTTITDGTATMTGGTVSATQFTTGSFNGTTGTFSGNLTVDTNVLYVDSASNEVGINTSSPGFDLDVNGDINLNGVIRADGNFTSNQYLKVNSAGDGMEYVDIQAVLAGNGVVSKPLSAPFPNAIGNERDVTMWQSNTVITGNTNMLTYDLSTGQLNVKSNGTGSAILSIQDTGAGNNAELVKDDSDLKIRSGGGNIKFSGDTDSTNIGDFQVYSSGAYQNIMHTGNGGSGSNFDADLLDGQQGSEFSRKVLQTTTDSTTNKFYQIAEWTPTNPGTRENLTLTLLIKSFRDLSQDGIENKGTSEALVSITCATEISGLIDQDVEILSYSGYTLGSGTDENILSNIIITGSTGTPHSDHPFGIWIEVGQIDQEIVVYEVSRVLEAGTLDYSVGSWTTSPSGILTTKSTSNLNFSSSLMPRTTNTRTLGTSSLRWSNIYGVLGNFSGTVTGPSGTWDSGGIDIASGDTYAINGTDVLTATTLESGVTGSSLTSVGTLNSGSISSGFGNINIGSSTFTGNGSGLTNLVAANISTGSLADGVNLHYTKDDATATAYFVSFTNASTTAGSGNKDSLFSNKFSFTPSTGRITSNQISVNASGLIIDGSAVTATAAELNVLVGYTGSVTELNYLDTLHATGVTSTEFDYLDGVTSNIQTQLNGKQATITGGASTITSSNLTASRALISDGSGKVAVSSTITSTELGYLNGVTSDIQTQLNAKQATITGGATTITSSNLTASRALISNASGKVAISATTSTELGYLNAIGTPTDGGIVYGDGTGLKVTAAGTTGQYLRSAGTGVPIWDTINLGTDTAGNYMVDASGGTGITVTHTPSEGSTATIAVDSTVVTTSSGTQTIVGNKTFSNTIDFNGTVTSSSSFTADGGRIRLNDNIELEFGTGGTSDAYMYWNGTDLFLESTSDVYFDFNGTSDNFIIRDGAVTRFTLDATTGDLTLATGDFIASSDARVKDNIETITDSINVLNQLRPVSYTRKDHVDKETKHYGLIAQEVMNVLPAIVHGSEEDGYKLSYIQLISHLIEGIQTLDKRVKELENGN